MARPRKTAGRVATQKQASQSLGCDPRSLRLWEKESWWKPEFRTAAGYDVEAILRARAVLGKHGSEMAEASSKLTIAKKKADYDIAQADLRRKLRQEQEELGNILPRDVFEEFVRELLAKFRHDLEHLPDRIARQASPQQMSLIRTADGTAPLQRELRKVMAEFERWLQEGPDHD